MKEMLSIFFTCSSSERKSTPRKLSLFLCSIFLPSLMCFFFLLMFHFFFLVFFFVARQHIFSLFFFDPYFSTDDFYWFWRKRSMKITFYIKFLRLAVEGSRAGCQMHTKANCRIVGCFVDGTRKKDWNEKFEKKKKKAGREILNRPLKHYLRLTSSIIQVNCDISQINSSWNEPKQKRPFI